MRNQSNLYSILNGIFLCIFLFAFLMLPVGCNQTSSPESANIDSNEITKPQENVEPQEIVEAKETVEPKEAGRIDEVASETNEIALLEMNEDWDVQFGISNQVPGISPIDIKVYIDDKLVINEEFEVGNQHNWKPFYLKLNKGKHELRLESEKGNASFKQTFEVTGMVKHPYEITGRQWVDIIFTINPMRGFSPGNFQGAFIFHIQNKPFVGA